MPARPRRPRGASRAALAPTFFSGQLCLGDLRANPLAHASISRRMNQAVARACHRRYWPETNVGASAARDCAARAALDLRTTTSPKPSTPGLPRYLMPCAVPVKVRRWSGIAREAAPPARRIASCARSYVFFGPIMPGGFAREPFGACLNIASYEPGGRARLSQASLARNKRRSERSSRCAARAALDLRTTTNPTPSTPGLPRYLMPCAVPVKVRRWSSIAREAAPPARRIASCARSYVCFGPIMPGGFAREPFGACLNIASYEAAGRARLSQASLARNKRRSERSSRCAARAALDLRTTTNPTPSTTGLPRYLMPCAVPVKVRRWSSIAREAAPPARRIASCARSYVFFGPVMPGPDARERFGPCLHTANHWRLDPCTG
ncbi:hypothetical protein PSEG_01297 [Pseudomonas sp. Nvir]